MMARRGRTMNDPWNNLTRTEREAILETSRLHYEWQLSVGIPLDDIYGPWTVWKFGATFVDYHVNSPNNRE